MNQAVAKKEMLPAFAMQERELIEVLRSSLYPGAQDGSIKMVIGYCRASGLDPMQKPVHIVPMWDSKTKSMRDVIMPGIGSYRVQAARSGGYAGISEPEFGADVTESLDGVQITYPSWCRVVVKRLLSNGAIAEFAATERWTENYATAKKDSAQPNAMWRRRPYAQLAKCAEAQALRKAFPEVGAQPTADEMEGRPFDYGGDVIDERTGEIVRGEPQEPQPLPPYPADKFRANLPAWHAAIDAGRITPDQIIAKVSSAYTLTREQIEALNLPPESPETIHDPEA